MRLRDYQDLINRTIPIIEQLSISQTPINGYPNLFQVSNVQNFLRITEELKQAKLFLTSISQIDNVANLKNAAENVISINSQSKNILNNIKTEVLNSAKLLQKTLNEVLTEEDSDTLSIKLPPNYSSIKDFKNFFDELEIICMPFKYINEEVQITCFDVGSEWIGLKLISNSIGLFLSLADKSANLFNHVLECQKTIEELEKVKLDKSESKIKIINQTIDLLKKDKEKEREEYIDKLIEEAIAESKIVLKKDINNNEFKNHLRKSMEKLGSLIIRGLDIVPALKAKPEIKQLSMKATANIEEKRKLIIGIDNLKYLTILDTDVKSKDIPADTAELPE